MNAHARDFETAAAEQVSRVETYMSPLADSTSTILSETLDYSKRSMVETSSFVQELVGKRDLGDAMRLQTEFMQKRGEAFLGHCQKLTELYRDMTVAAFQPRS